MLNILIDTNIVLDQYLDRDVSKITFEDILDYSAKKCVKLFMQISCIKDIYYILKKFTHNNELARDTINELCLAITFIDQNYKDLTEGLKSDMDDLEDAMLAYSAERYGLDLIVTNNIKDFTTSPIPAITPDEIERYIEYSSLEHGTINIEEER